MILDPLCTSVPAPTVITLAPDQGPVDLTPHPKVANAAESNHTPPCPSHLCSPSIRSPPCALCGSWGGLP
ncbi:hypothetical protein CKAH01_00683 [Colletotrichum kahawae]|uniref:Uncharacterized protein n=1 Tax=Colletotrichum kahawae TaxID=34407 RepID=A0AAD9YHP3_COLKA|nr:hypothetical protein CKAH01_00683 [Colletotrichum kahawae]